MNKKLIKDKSLKKPVVHRALLILATEQWTWPTASNGVPVYLTANIGTK